ncbi:hypothetical protein NCU16857 [Neurospora crassa OR74A]|uniref:Uncharacterized protein n=1 Tax=Neurospora crassa (strain ATCC 24698 / 74-OR23-1A / CBS 708.71 / DSM 1257 / FGSC 987) TaxID=367110 RepID=V5IQH9_NEUCR|nr:hypothetical protein NCU16857 [Neurospora crassa OR74A]ESA43021.1 hypothetical protein NCU16857 [Neurospora crassa OR74A]|eukprot:XP_011394429.1 hypothetical protein NCU16857 [Neurospora crassa OR74A]
MNKMAFVSRKTHSNCYDERGRVRDTYAWKSTVSPIIGDFSFEDNSKSFMCKNSPVRPYIARSGDRSGFAKSPPKSTQVKLEEMHYYIGSFQQQTACFSCSARLRLPGVNNIEKAMWITLTRYRSHGNVSGNID